MTAPSLSSVILSVFEEQEEDRKMTVAEITAAVKQRVEERNRLPADNAIRGRLSQLHKEGVLKRPDRGVYTLVRTEPKETKNLKQLVDIVSDRIRPSALRRTVLWDATPYLHLAEDGGPGTRLVVEHKKAGSFQDEVEVAWPNKTSIATWITKTSGPLGTLLWEPDNPTAYRVSMGIVFVERERFGGTGITPGGYRTPFPERILVEFLGEDGPPEAATIVRNLLQDPNVDLNRLWAAAETLGATVNVGVLLAGLRPELRPELRKDFTEKLSPVTGTLIKGER